MKMHTLFGAAMSLLVALPAARAQAVKTQNPRAWNPETLTYAGEKHLNNVRQLTFGADNAEAYWSFDSKSLIFQSNNSEWGAKCDQIYHYTDAGHVVAKPKMLSTGMGRTTCAYFMPGDREILYASTHLGGEACPPEPERTHGRYVWPIYETFDVFVADLEGRITRQLTDAPGYDAEATVSPKGDRIVFTSDRSGDLELYTMKLDGSDVRQVTFTLGYDGGAFLAPTASGSCGAPRAPARPKRWQSTRASWPNTSWNPPTWNSMWPAWTAAKCAKSPTWATRTGRPFLRPTAKRFCSAATTRRRWGFRLTCLW